MKVYFRILSLTLVSSILLLASCGPAPNPKLARSAEPQKQEPPPERRPAAAAPVEEPPAPVAVKPRQQVAMKQVPARRPVVVRPGSDEKPSSAAPQNPAPAVSSAASGTMTLPAPIAPPIPIPAPPPDEVTPERVEPPAPRHIRVPPGTLVAVRLIDPVDSETAHAGETFKASLDEPIVVDDETVFPKDGEVYVKLSKVQSAGRVSGKSEIQLQLDRIFLGQKSYLVESNTYVTAGSSQAARTAKTAGVGAAIGAAIGAISGGGKGAVIGGAAGAGAGAGVEAIRKGEQVRVDSETKLVFRLEDSIEVTLESPSSVTPQRVNPSGPLRFGTRQH